MTDEPPPDAAPETLSPAQIHELRALADAIQAMRWLGSAAKWLLAFVLLLATLLYYGASDLEKLGHR